MQSRHEVHKARKSRRLTPRFVLRSASSPARTSSAVESVRAISEYRSTSLYPVGKRCRLLLPLTGPRSSRPRAAVSLRRPEQSSRTPARCLRGPTQRASSRASGSRESTGISRRRPRRTRRATAGAMPTLTWFPSSRGPGGRKCRSQACVVTIAAERGTARGTQGKRGQRLTGSVNYLFLWLSDGANVGTMQQAASIISLGLSWKEATGAM